MVAPSVRVRVHAINKYYCLIIMDYHKSGNICCKNIFVVDGSYKN